jgi:predicted RNase H-like HicB family nuclease
MSIVDTIWDCFDFLKYEVLKKELPKVSLPKKLKIEQGYDRKNKTYWVECEELPGFVATASSKKVLLKEFYETLLVYFDVPRYLAKKMNKYGELVMSDGRVIKMIDTEIALNYAN